MKSADIFSASRDEMDFARLSAEISSSPSAVKAVCQLLFHHLDLSREHEIIIDTTAEARHYNAGSAGTCTDLLNELMALADCNVTSACLSGIRERFPMPKVEEIKV